jgi:WD40 repeat protein
VRTTDIADRVEALQFGPDGDRIIVGTSGAIQWVNASTGSMEHSWAGTGTATFSPDGKRLAIHAIASGADRTTGAVDLINLETKETERSLVCNPGKGRSWLLSIAFSEDGQRVAAGDWNGSVTVWNVADGKPIGGSITAAGGVHCVRFLESNRIITGSEDGLLQIHTLEE